MSEPRDPSFAHAASSFGGVVFIVIAGLLWFGVNLHILLILSLVWVAANASTLGLDFRDIRSAMISGIEKGLGAIFIFVLIGVLIAALIEAGTVGSLVYYGVDILHPALFLPAGLVLCSFMSVVTGTAWGTVGTIGIVLMGLGGAIGIPLPLVAGMVVSGASFGDKMSPVSDTTVLASMSAETDVYSHIRAMLYTTVPAYLIALALFTTLGLQYSGQAIADNEVIALREALSAEFSIGLWTLLPLVVLLGFSMRRVAVEPSMLAAVAAAILCAVMLQGRGVVEVLASLQDGYVAVTNHELLETLLNRGGIQSMMWTLSLALIALALGGLLDRTGFVRVMLAGVLTRIRRAATLMTATIGSGLVANMSMGEAYLSIIFGGQIFRDSYASAGLRKTMLSRCLEEGATLTTSLIPWTTAGAFYTGVLGISPLAYAPWTFFN
ncbi:MAG TPA: Na+/H+ antiporter NhaC, partial [Gammaproteobacteria bacterium]